MENKSSPRVRPLYDWEIQEAQRVFANQLRYEPIRIHESVTWPNTMNRLGASLKRIQYVEAPNAVTLGNHCFFPVRLPEQLPSTDDAQHSRISWLIHELTHVWQYQKLGWRYLTMALSAQFRYGVKAYDFGDEQGLIESATRGLKIFDFNLEQQGDIIRSYYDRLARGINVDAWQPFIAEIQQKLEDLVRK